MTLSKILVAHDLSEPAERALSFAAELGNQVGAKVLIAYVHPDAYDGHGDPSLTLPGALPGQGERYLRFLEEELRHSAEKVVGSEHGAIECHVLRGDPVKRIESAAEALGADVICVGATGKGAVQRVLLGSVSQLLLRSSPVPVLVVP